MDLPGTPCYPTRSPQSTELSSLCFIAGSHQQPVSHTVLVLVAQSCLTLRDPTAWNPPGPSACGLFLARILEWVAMPSPGFYTWQCVPVSATLPIHPALASPSLCPHVHSLCLCLSICLDARFTCTTFLESTNMREYPISVFLLLTRFTEVVEKREPFLHSW